MIKTRWAIALVVAAGVLGGGRAEAAKCTISTAPIVFGIYDVFNTAPLDTTGTLVYECNGAKNVSIGISRGQGTVAARLLRKGTEALGYNLFLDPTLSTIWGDGNGAGEMYYIRNPPNKPTTVPVYGRIPAGQDISAGTYADSVTVTVNF